MGTWTRDDPRWQSLNPYERASAMAIMEADGRDPQAQELLTRMGTEGL